MTALDAPLIVASNRGPVSFERNADGVLEPQRGTGGLVTALVAALQDERGVWVAAAMSEGDRQLMGETGGSVIDVRADGARYRLRYLDIEPETYDGYYNGISNGVLWFVHHYLWDTVRSPIFDEATQRAWASYVEVNRLFARALAEEAERSQREPVFLVQDYHLALVPQFLRELRPESLISHFSHTAIAGLTYLRILPTRMRERLLRGMLGADVLGFHSQAWAENFLMSARSLSGVRVDLARSRVTLEGREVAVRVHPISIDARPMRQAAATREVRRMRGELNRWRGNNRLIVRVDRLELTKNVVRGLLAYELFLLRYPQWRGRVRFLALLSPSRVELPEYRTYTEECLAEAERINRELGDELDPDRRPCEGRLPRRACRLRALRRPDGEPGLRRDEPRRHGGTGVESTPRRPAALTQRRCLLPAESLRAGDQPLRRGRDGRRTRRGARDAPGRTSASRAWAFRDWCSPTSSRWIGGQLEDLERARLRRSSTQAS